MKSILGMTSEGGGAVAFPVMTLALQIPPAIARDFSLMIQSCGKGSIFKVNHLAIHLLTSQSFRYDCCCLHHFLDANQTGVALHLAMQLRR